MYAESTNGIGLLAEGQSYGGWFESTNVNGTALYADGYSHLDGKVRIGENPNTADLEGQMRYNSTTKEFEGYDGSNWNILSGGSELVGAKIRIQNTISLPASVVTDINYNIVVYDFGAGFDFATGEYNIPESGVYSIVINSDFKGGVGVGHQLYYTLDKQGSTPLRTFNNVLGTTGDQTISMSGTFELSAGDVLEFKIYNNGAQPVELRSFGTSRSSITITKL